MEVGDTVQYRKTGQVCRVARVTPVTGKILIRPVDCYPREIEVDQSEIIPFNITCPKCGSKMRFMEAAEIITKSVVSEDAMLFVVSNSGGEVTHSELSCTCGFVDEAAYSTCDGFLGGFGVYERRNKDG